VIEFSNQSIISDRSQIIEFQINQQSINQSISVEAVPLLGGSVNLPSLGHITGLEGFFHVDRHTLTKVFHE